MTYETENDVLQALRTDGTLLDGAPRRFVNTRTCLAAVAQNGLALEFVPDELRTEGLCLAAVEQNGDALRFVPEALKTEPVCLAAFVKGAEGGAGGPCLLDVPFCRRTRDVCAAAVANRPADLRYVPFTDLTPSMIMGAVEATQGRALAWLPAFLQTPARCLEAVRDHGARWEHVPAGCRTMAVLLAAYGYGPYETADAEEDAD